MIYLAFYILITAAQYVEAINEFAFEGVQTDMGTRAFFLMFAAVWPVTMTFNVGMFVWREIKLRFRQG